MKSLEIVNLCLEELLNNKTEICEYDLLKIKQDLEVLEIIKKHLEAYIWQNIFSKEHELEVDIILKHIDNEEERYKVKQWLEG